MAFDMWRISFTYEGILLAHGVPRLINIRYADDVWLYAKSFKELEQLTERLLDALKAIGLSLNATTTNILRCNVSEDDSSLNFVEIEGEFMEVLDDTNSHRYLEKLFCISITERIIIEFRSRKRAAWAVFAKHKAVLLDHNLSLQLRLKYFSACIGHAMLFGTLVMPMSKIHLQKFIESEGRW